MRLYANIVALRQVMARGRLPASYYLWVCDPGASGVTIKDPWLVVNSEYALGEYQRELEKRGLMDKFTVFVLC